MAKRKKKKEEPWWLVTVGIVVMLVLVYNAYRIGVGELQKFGG